MRRIKVPAESKTASKATRDFFEILDHSGVPRPIVAEKAGIHVNNFYGWKNGRISATITNMEAALAVLGMGILHPPDSAPTALAAAFCRTWMIVTIRPRPSSSRCTSPSRISICRHTPSSKTQP